MALHKSTANAASTLARLKSKKAQLELKANQLAARKNDVEAKTDQLGRSLKRTIDTREKILLGALMKMTGMGRFTLEQRNGVDTLSNREQNGNVTAYDLDFLVGALLALSEQLHNDNDMATFDGLRQRGREFRSSSKADRVHAPVPDRSGRTPGTPEHRTTHPHRPRH